ncbi:MAG: hypothetical protein ACK58L_14925 [Planctomycetota bacterium]
MKRLMLLLTAGAVFLMTSRTCSVAYGSDIDGVIPMAVPSYGGFAVAQPMFGSMALHPSHAHGDRRGDHVSDGDLPLTSIPPGTIGQTYLRKSHPVPANEHPRTGMLAVRDNGAVQFMSVQNMDGIRMKSGIWLFESHRPLDPGACQIIRVEARYSERDIEPYQTRFVRLIPGRIVYLDF